MNILRLSISRPTSIYRGFAALCQIHLKNEMHTSSLLNAKKTLPFEYVEPVKEPFNLRKWDLEDLKKVDLNQPMLAFVNSTELNSDKCSEATKKIFSLGFAVKRKVTNDIKLRYMASVQKHVLDTGSFESTIAALTIKIRGLQIYVKNNPKNRVNGVPLKHAIDRRNKWLNMMRSRDYPRFEWLIKELNIVYQLPEKYQCALNKHITIREMTQKYCEQIRIKKIGAIREKLQAQQADFLKEKEEKLRFIAEEEKALGLSSEIEAPQPVDEEKHLLPPPPVASSLPQIAQTAEGPYEEPPYVKKPKLS